MQRDFSQSHPQATGQVRQELARLHPTPLPGMLGSEPGEAVEYRLPPGGITK